MKPDKTPYARSELEKDQRAQDLRRRFAAATPLTRGPLRTPLFNGWRSIAAIVLLLILVAAWVF